MANNHEWSSKLLEKSLSTKFKEFIEMPSEIDSVPKYFRMLENRILLPPQLLRQANCKKSQEQNDKFAKISRRNHLLLKLIESKDFSFKKNPILSRKRNIHNITLISELFGESKIKYMPYEIITNICGFLIDKPDEFIRIPKIDARGLSKFNSQCYNIIFGNLLNLGYISQEIYYHLSEFTRYEKDRRFTIPHPAKNSIDFLYKYQINVFDISEKPPYIPMEKYFESNDDNRLIQDKEDLKEADLILEGISFKVF